MKYKFTDYTRFFLYPLFMAVMACGQNTGEKENGIYMFSYFIGNGEDGLHYAYSEDGYHFMELGNGKSYLKPEVGNDKLMRDPCIIRGGDGKFHMVWTVSWNEKGIGYANSEDLIHWSEQQYIPVMEHEEDARNTWAPEVFYDGSSDTYYVFWSTTIRGLFPETQSEEDDGYNHRKYYATTKDFVVFSETKLFYEPGFNVIDGTIIHNGDEYVMFIKDETRTPPQKNIRITKSKSLDSGFGSASEPITGDYWAEGPTPAIIGDQVVVYFDKYMEKKMGAVSSSDWTNWTDISDQIQFPEGSRHGTVFKITESELTQLKNAEID